MHPSGPGNGEARDLAGCSRLSGKLLTNSGKKVARSTDSSQRPELWPRNVSRLHAAGIRFEWRRSSRDIVLTCICGAGKLVIDDSRPWAWCFSAKACVAGKLKFDDLVWRLSK